MGYIGSHTVVSLIEHGFDVVIIDNLINSKEDTLDGIESITGVRPEFVNLDLCNPTLVDDCLKKHENEF